MAASPNLPGGMTLVAYSQTIDPGGALTPISAVPDPHVFTQGTDIRVPNKLNMVMGWKGMVNDASVTRRQLQAPSLRSTLLPDDLPIDNSAVFSTAWREDFNPANLLPLRENEAMDFAFLSDPAAPVLHCGLVWLCDAPRQPVTGPMWTIRATSAISLVANTWVNGQLTLAQSLPAGRYQVVGFRAQGQNLLAARLVFQGFPWRPGVNGVISVTSVGQRYFRYGQLGVWGEFDQTVPPTVDCLGSVDAAQVYLLDLIPLQ